MEILGPTKSEEKFKKGGTVLGCSGVKVVSSRVCLKKRKWQGARTQGMRRTARRAARTQKHDSFGRNRKRYQKEEE